MGQLNNKGVFHAKQIAKCLFFLGDEKSVFLSLKFYQRFNFPV
jgi:hypothetical protein